jgi:hypothetical protein
VSTSALRPPPLPDECPAVAYEIDVTRRSDYLTVRARLIHQMPDGTWKPGIGSMNDGDPLVAYVNEPCRLLRLLGDTIERRVARAKARVARAAERQIAQQRRLDAALEAVS